MKGVLVTGAGGFLGYHLLKELYFHGKYEVWGGLSHIPHKKWDDVALYAKPYYADIMKMKTIPYGIDCIIHCAAMKSGDKNRMFEVNVKGTKNLLECSQGVRQFIYISTSFIEAFSSDYTRTKAYGEQLVKKAYRDKKLLHYTILRLPHMYGPGMMNSYLFVHAYRIWKRKYNFPSKPRHVKDVAKEIEDVILNRKYYEARVTI